MTLRGKSPPPPMVTMPASSACSMSVQTVSASRSCSWMVWQVVKCARFTPQSRMACATKASFSGVTRPPGMRRRSMLALPPFWA